MMGAAASEPVPLARAPLRRPAHHACGMPRAQVAAMAQPDKRETKAAGTAGLLSEAATTVRGPD